jgi:hypothetical protein
VWMVVKSLLATADHFSIRMRLVAGGGAIPHG